MGFASFPISVMKHLVLLGISFTLIDHAYSMQFTGPSNDSLSVVLFVQLFGSN